MKRASLSFLTGPGAARVLLAAALLATSLSSSVPAGPESTTPGSPIAAMTETPRLIQRILADEFEAQPIESDEAVEKQLARAGISAEFKQFVRGKSAVSEIVELAESTDVSLVIVGLRKRSAVGKLILGSVSRDILLSVPCPVLAVKASQ